MDSSKCGSGSESSGRIGEQRALTWKLVVQEDVDGRWRKEERRRRKTYIFSVLRLEVLQFEGYIKLPVIYYHIYCDFHIQSIFYFGAVFSKPSLDIIWEANAKTCWYLGTASGHNDTALFGMGQSNPLSDFN